MATTNPIIVFGTGRSGTTVLHEMLAQHERLAWMSWLCDNYPERLGLNRFLMKMLELSSAEEILRRKFNPGECYLFWNHYSKGFSAPCRDLMASDVTVKGKKSILHAMSQLTTEKRDRMLLKITGWPRIGFLSEVFSDAKFIHVTRDGRAVANSLINVGFWRGWGGPEKWRWGILSKEHQEEWLGCNQSFLALAAIQWKILMDAAEEAKRHVDPSRVMDARYEDLCADPIGVFRKIAAFCQVEWSSSFEARLKSRNLRNTNSKYEQELTLPQQRMLNDVLGGHLKKFGYCS